MRSIRRTAALGFGLAGLLLMLTIGIVLAQGSQLNGKLLTGSDVTIPAGETVDHDIYAFAGTITSNGTINGDIVAAGGNIDLNGPVMGDVLATGGRISINGPVSGDIRAAGGQVTIAGDVAEDVLVTGGQVTIGSRVGQDLIVSGGQLNLTGSVTGSAVGTVGAYTKSGSIAGTDSIAVTGNQSSAFANPSNPVLDAIRQFIVVLLVAVLALWLVPRAFGVAETQVRARPLPSFGWGIGAVIGYVVLIVVICVVAVLLAIVLGLLGFGALVGIDVFGAFVLVSGITLAFIVAAAFLADAIVGLALARAFAARSGRPAVVPGGASMPGRDRWSDVGLLAIGVAIVVVLTSLPIIGSWLKVVVVLLGLGAIWLAWRRSRPTTPVGMPPEPPSPLV
jgi:cytoskeletal protein CcmA (bactofilin family)